MNFIIRSYRESDKDDVIQLWKECELVVPWNDPQSDIERKQTVQSELFLIGLMDEEIVATAMAGYDGHRGWVYYLAVKPKYQQQGIGEKMMNKAEHALLKLGCPKLNIMVRTTNSDVINFYKAVGYKIDGVTTMSKRLIPDE
ncbi:MAG: GNAT family acetyltransferase [Candidatus Neomarinimicrobiota bacterium]